MPPRTPRETAQHAQPRKSLPCQGTTEPSLWEYKPSQHTDGPELGRMVSPTSSQAFTNAKTRSTAWCGSIETYSSRLRRNHSNKELIGSKEARSKNATILSQPQRIQAARGDLQQNQNGPRSSTTGRLPIQAVRTAARVEYKGNAKRQL